MYEVTYDLNGKADRERFKLLREARKAAATVASRSMMTEDPVTSLRDGELSRWSHPEPGGLVHNNSIVIRVSA